MSQTCVGEDKLRANKVANEAPSELVCSPFCGSVFLEQLVSLKAFLVCDVCLRGMFLLWFNCLTGTFAIAFRCPCLEMQELLPSRHELFEVLQMDKRTLTHQLILPSRSLEGNLRVVTNLKKKSVEPVGVEGSAGSRPRVIHGVGDTTNVSLQRRRLLTGAIEASCAQCRSQNFQPPVCALIFNLLCVPSTSRQARVGSLGRGQGVRCSRQTW